MQRPVNHKTQVISLEEIKDYDTVAVGAKAVSLARMSSIGLPVPPGFCVTGAAEILGISRATLNRRLKKYQESTRI